MSSSGAHPSDDRVLFDVDPDNRIATITLNNPKQRNSYDASMRDSLARCLDRSPRTTISPWSCCAARKACSAPVPI